MKKTRVLPFDLNLQLFAADPEPKPEPEPVLVTKITVGNKTYDAAAIEALANDNHSIKSQLGDVQKQLKDIKSQDLTEVERLQNENTDLKTKLSEKNKSLQKSYVEIEASTNKLRLDVANNISIDEGDTREKIAEKIKASKTNFELLLAEEIKNRGLTNEPINGNVPGDKEKTQFEKYAEKGKSSIKAEKEPRFKLPE